MDYMRGYNNRNSRRRSTYSRRRDSYKRHRRRPGTGSFSILKLVVPAAFLAVAAIGVFFFWPDDMEQTGKQAATSAGVQVVQTAGQPAATPEAADFGYGKGGGRLVAGCHCEANTRAGGPIESGGSYI